MLRYIKLKTGYHENGPAWIGRVQLSRSGRTVYFNGKAFKRQGRGASGNHYDVETGERYWISGIKKNGCDRHWAGSGKIVIEAASIPEYLTTVAAKRLDPQRFVIAHDIQPTDPTKFVEVENRAWPNKMF